METKTGQVQTVSGLPAKYENLGRSEYQTASRAAGDRFAPDPKPDPTISTARAILELKQSLLLSPDVLNGQKLQRFNEDLRQTEPIMQLGEKELQRNPEALKPLLAQSVAITERFADELRHGMQEAQLDAQVSASDKQPARILEKLGRKTRETGKYYTIADLGDISRCRIQVNTVSEIYKAAEKVRQMYGDRIVEWLDTILHPHADGYTGRIHVTILSEDRKRKLELQITTRDLKDVNNKRFPVTEDYSGNFHDMVYKGLGGKDPSIMEEYGSIMKAVLALNDNGKRLDSDPGLCERVRRLRERLVELYRATPKDRWPQL